MTRNCDSRADRPAESPFHRDWRPSSCSLPIVSSMESNWSRPRQSLDSVSPTAGVRCWIWLVLEGGDDDDTISPAGFFSEPMWPNFLASTRQLRLKRRVRCHPKLQFWIPYRDGCFIDRRSTNIAKHGQRAVNATKCLNHCPDSVLFTDVIRYFCQWFFVNIDSLIQT